MKLSNKGRYAILALVDLAIHRDQGATQVRQICGREEIPPRFLEQVFQDLKRAGIVRSKRGPRGGYQLSREPSDVRLGDIIRAIEGPLAMVNASAGPVEDASPSQLAMQAMLGEVARRIDACLDDTTLSDMVERAESMAVDSGRSSAYVYAI